VEYFISLSTNVKLALLKKLQVFLCNCFLSQKPNMKFSIPGRKIVSRQNHNQTEFHNDLK